MSELYWITRLDGLQAFFLVLLIISAGIAMFSLLQWYSDDFDEENVHWKSLRIFLPIAVISALGIVFVPSTRDALIIYGVGGTVEYLRDNPTARRIPDKCINALDKFMDEYINEEKQR